MRSKNTILKTLVIFSTLILLILSKQGFCDDAGDPFSSESASNIGAWYDETYQAKGFYRLEQDKDNPDNFYYAYTPDPTANSKSAFVKESSEEEKEIEETAEHKHKYTDAPGGASMPQDIVVTEWWVTGHVHFAHTGE